MGKGIIRSEPSPALDTIYEENQPASSAPSSGPDSRPKPNSTSEQEDEERLVLSKEAVPKIVGLFELPPTAAADLYRALEQTEHRLKEARS